MDACEAALANGTKVRDAFMVAAKLAGTVTIPLLFMAYANTVYRYGVEQFCRDAAEAGISGLIIPDMPLEAAEREGLLQYCRKHNLHNIVTLAPSSTEERLHLNRPITSGFAYCMGYQGITGGQIDVNESTRRYLANVRKHITVPLALGFGITNHAQLAAAQQYADIAVVGSALIGRLKNIEPAHAPEVARAFIRELLGE
jgi:tryptophan synthase alpha subunit